MAVERFAGQSPEVASAMRKYMDSRALRSPAFALNGKGEFEPTADSQRVLGELQRIGGGKPFNLRPANSVDAMNGEPLWGTGSGYVGHDHGQIGSTGVVDPFEGDTHVVAHEGAHAVLPTALNKDFVQGRLNAPVHPVEVPRDNGARLRYVYNIEGAPAVAEEAHAQGVASGILDRLNLPQSADWDGDPLQYPLGYTGKAIHGYRSMRVGNQNMTVGPSSPGEINEMKRIYRGAVPFAERMFKEGYGKAR